MATYSGEITRPESGEGSWYAENIEGLLRIVRSLQPGDCLVINRQE